MTFAEARNRAALSAAHEVATDLSVRARHDGTDEGAFLSVAESRTLSASVVDIASIGEGLSSMAVAASTVRVQCRVNKE